MPLATLSLDRAGLAHRFQLALESGDPLLDTAAIDFQLRFTRTTRANSTGLPRQVMPHPGETRQKILQLSQLDLQTAFTAARALCENIQDQLRTIENFARKQIREVPSLRRRELIG